jgi:hypothetical protein
MFDENVIRVLHKKSIVIHEDEPRQQVLLLELSPLLSPTHLLYLGINLQFFCEGYRSYVRSVF